MEIAVDLIALAIVVICAAVAYFRGFVKTFFGFISVIVALVLAFFFYKPLGVYIKDSTDIDDWVYESIVSLNKEKTKEELPEDHIILSTESGENTSGEEKVKDETKDATISEKLMGMVDSLPTSINDSLNASLNLNEKKEQLVMNIATKVSDIVVNILAWVSLFVGIRIILLILMLIFDSLMQLPGLKEVNNVFGLILGAVMGIFRVYLILAIIYFISNVAQIDAVVDGIQDSMVVSHLYNNNILINLIF